MVIVFVLDVASYISIKNTLDQNLYHSRKLYREKVGVRDQTVIQLPDLFTKTILNLQLMKYNLKGAKSAYCVITIFTFAFGQKRHYTTGQYKMQTVDWLQTIASRVKKAMGLLLSRSHLHGENNSLQQSAVRILYWPIKKCNELDIASNRKFLS